MNYLICNLKNSLPFVMADYSTGNVFDLETLGSLLGVRAVERIPDGTVVNSSIGNINQRENFAGGIEFFANRRCVKGIAPENEEVYTLRQSPGNLESKVWGWRSLVIHGCISKILRGEKVMLMHGALLGLHSGDGLFVCGQSGMGKTTTSRRWMEAGGVCHADDMALMEYTDDELIAHALPTWSRCLESVDGEARTTEKLVSVKTLLSLTRDEEREYVQEEEGHKSMMSIYASCSCFSINLLKQMPASYQQRVIAAIRQCTSYLYDRFPHLVFYANLQGNIKETLKGF